MPEIDLTVFDVPVNQIGKLGATLDAPEGDAVVVDFSPEALEELITSHAETIASFDMTKVDTLKEFTVSLHQYMRKDQRVVMLLTPEARAVYFKTLELHNGLYLEEAANKSMTTATKKKAKANANQIALEITSDDLKL